MPRRRLAAGVALRVEPSHLQTTIDLGRYCVETDLSFLFDIDVSGGLISQLFVREKDAVKRS